MNRSLARLALTCLTLTALGLGACGTSIAHTPPPAAGPSDPNVAAAVAPAATTAAPKPATAVSAPTPRVRPARSPCRAEEAWSAKAKNGSAAMSQAALYLTRVGQHACYDRVVFDINGPQNDDPPRARGLRRQVRTGRKS